MDVCITCDTGETMDFMSMPDAATLRTGSLDNDDCGVREGWANSLPGAGENDSGAADLKAPLLPLPSGCANILPAAGKGDSDVLLGEALRRDDWVGLK